MVEMCRAAKVRRKYSPLATDTNCFIVLVYTKQ